MTAFVDTNIIVRHLTGHPEDMAARATQFLRTSKDLLLSDVIVAETVFVLESAYKAPRPQVAEAVRACLLYDAFRVVEPTLVLRALEIYESERLDFAEAYLVASAESSGVPVIVSFDRSIDRVSTVQRIEP